MAVVGRVVLCPVLTVQALRNRTVREDNSRIRVRSLCYTPCRCNGVLWAAGYELYTVLTIDDREPDSVFTSIVESPAFNDNRVRIEVQHLETGDFALSYYNRKGGVWVPTVGIESKTWSDLVGSMSGQKSPVTGKRSKGRLYSQLTRLRPTYPVSVLLLKGVLETYTWDPNPLNRMVRLHYNSLTWYDSPWTVKEVRGMVLAVQGRGTRTIEVPDYNDLPWYLRFLHDHYEGHRDDVDHFYRGVAAVPLGMLDIVPRITPADAERLHLALDENPRSIAGVIAAPLAEIEKLIAAPAAKELYSRLH